MSNVAFQILVCNIISDKYLSLLDNRIQQFQSSNPLR